MIRTLTWPLALALVACGAPTDEVATDDTGDSDTQVDTDTEDTTEDTEDTEDTPDDTEEQPEAPSIVTMLPAADAVGVLPDSVIEVHFSVPMDTASVEAAFTSVVLGDDYTLAWPDSKRLVITPTEGLPVASYDPEGQGAEVDIGISHSAKSLDGVEMNGPYWASFRVARSYQANLDRDDALTGRVASTGTGTLDRFHVGDTTGNVSYRAYSTFKLDNVPEILGVTQVVFSVKMEGYTGTPWDVLGNLNIHPVAFEALDDTAYAASPVGNGKSGHEPANETLNYTIDVTSQFAGAFALPGVDVAQFRLAFSQATDGDGGIDYAVFVKDENSPRLTVDLLVE